MIHHKPSNKLAIHFFVLVFSITTFLLIVIGGAVSIFFDDWSQTPPPTEHIRLDTETLLQAAQFTASIELSPKPSVAEERCINVLRKEMKRNNNHYVIQIIGVWGNDASLIPGGTGTITATVKVIFPNGTQIELQYYAYTLNICRELPNDEIF